MRTTNGLSKYSGEEKSGMDAHLCNKGQLLNLEPDYVRKEEDAEHVELERRYVVIWKKQHRLFVVQRKHSLEVLRQQHDSQMAGYWGRQQTPALVSRNLI